MANSIKNREIFVSKIVDNYNMWAKPWLDEIEKNSEKNIIELIKNENESEVANQAYKKIIDSYDLIDKVYKSQKIKSRKIANVFIYIFSFLIIGLFFLPFVFKNKKIIKSFNEFEAEQLSIINEQNEIKKQAFINLFANVRKKNLLNSFLNGTGLEVVGNNFGSNLEQFVIQLNNNYIGLRDYGCFKAGGQNIYVGNVCIENWNYVTTSSSISVPYTYRYTDSDGHTKIGTAFETVVAYHEELTPFRTIQTLTTVGYRKGIYDKDVDWTLIPVTPNLKKEEKEIDYLKSKKIATKKEDKIKNTTTFENEMFNIGYDVNIFNADGSIEQEQDILTWFTNATQEKFVQMRTDLAKKEKFWLIDQPLFKIGNSLIIKNNKYIDCSWYSNENVLNSLDYNPRTSLNDNIKRLASIANNVAINNMISTCEFLNFSKVNSMFILNPINYNYSLLDPLNQQIVNNRLDSESILNIGYLTKSFTSIGERKLIDNFRTVYWNSNDKFSFAVYDVDNYYTTNEIDVVQCYAPKAKRYVYINVPFVKYHAYKTQSVGFGILKTSNLIINNLIEKIKNTFSGLEFNYFEGENYLYVFANNTDVNESNVANIESKIYSLIG